MRWGLTATKTACGTVAEPEATVEACGQVAWLGPFSDEWREAEDMVQTPEPGAAEAMQAHILRIESAQRDHGATLAQIQATLAAMDQRLKGHDGVAADVRAIERRIDLLERTLDRKADEIQANTEMRHRINNLMWRIAGAALAGGATGGAAVAALMGG